MFKIEISSLHEFLVFVRVIRGSDEDLLKELTKDLKESNQELKDAVNQNITQET